MVNNTKYGSGALENNTGQNNTGIGAFAAYNNLAGFNNTSVGSNSAFFNTTGDNNTSLGSGSLCNNTIGSLNTAIGSSALEGNQNAAVGNQNTAVGAQALFSNEGDLNTAIGTYAALGVTGSNYNTFLGANTTASQSNLSYSTAIGYNSIIDASNQIKIGGLNSGIYPNVVIPGLANYITYNPSSYNINTIVPKQYVDQYASGISNKGPVTAISVSNITGTYSAVAPGSITGVTSPLVIDGITIIDGSSVLLNGQTNPVQNGIYTWSSGVTTLTRKSGMQNGQNAVAAYVFVKQGIKYAKSAWNQINNPAIVGDSSLNFIEFASFDYQLGRGLEIDNIGGVSTIDVDTSLNFINFLDSTNGVTGANGTLAMGTFTTNKIIIGPTGTSVPIQAQSIIQAQKGITGATGSFTYLSVNDISAGRIDVYDLSVNHLATIGTTTTNLASNFITTSGTINAGGLITAQGGITGATGSFQKLTCQNADLTIGTGTSGGISINGFGYFNTSGVSPLITNGTMTLSSSNINQIGTPNNNVFLSSNFPSGLTGATGSFSYLNSSNNTYLATTNGTKVGIGKTSAVYNLDVSGNFSVISSGAGEFSLEDGSANFSFNGFPYPFKGVKVFWNYPNIGSGRTTFLNNGQAAGDVGGFDFYECNNAQINPIRATLTCGHLGIGGIEFPNQTLDVSGNANFTQDISVNTLTIGLGGGQNIYNTAIGNSSLSKNTTGEKNTALGFNSLNNNTSGINNVAIGNTSLFTNITGSYNTAIGANSLNNNYSGSQNTAIGYSSLNNNNDGSYNVAIGYQSLSLNTNGNNNNALGWGSLYSNTIGANNNAFGYKSLYSNVTGSNNTAVGYNAGSNNTTFSNSTAIGANSQLTASNQIMLGGSNSGVYPQVVAPGGITGATGSFTTVTTTGNSTFNGVKFGKGNSSDAGTVGIGNDVFNYVPTGINNSAIGSNSLEYVGPGSYNVAIGNFALNGNVTGSNNVAIGESSLRLGQPNNCIGIGRTSLQVDNGTNNTAIGFNSGINQKTGQYNTFLGSQTSLNTTNPLSYSTAIGANSIIDASNQIMLGGLNNGVYPQVVAPGGIKVGNGAIGYGNSMDISGNVLLISEQSNTSTSAVGFGLGIISNQASNTSGVINTSIGVISKGYELGYVASRGTTFQSGPKNFFGIYQDALNNGNYNPITKQGDHVLFSGEYGSNPGSIDVSGGIVICPWSATASGARMDPSGNFTFYNIISAPAGITGTNANFSGTVTATTVTETSDYRIKENVIPLDDKFIVDSLIPVTYINKQTEKQDMGLIAHEVQEIYPFLVNGQKDGEELQSINYTSLIALLIKEIKDVKVRLTALEKK